MLNYPIQCESMSSLAKIIISKLCNIVCKIRSIKAYAIITITGAVANVLLQLSLNRVVSSFTWYVNFSPKFTLHLLITRSNDEMELKPFKWCSIQRLIVVFVILTSACRYTVNDERWQKREREREIFLRDIATNF